MYVMGPLLYSCVFQFVCEMGSRFIDTLFEVSLTEGRENNLTHEILCFYKCGIGTFIDIYKRQDSSFIYFIRPAVATTHVTEVRIKQMITECKSLLKYSLLSWNGFSNDFRCI